METRLELFKKQFSSAKPIIGMVHLRPLPGSPLYDGLGLDKTIEAALNDAEILLKIGGVNAIEVENFGDPSYFPDTAPPETVVSLAIVAYEIRKRYPEAILGICLLADPIASIAIAHNVKAQFIRATFFTEASVDVSGLALRRPHEILRYRKFLDPSIKIFADVHIKHSAPLVDRPIEDSAYDAAYFLADAVIISGRHTGFPTSVEDVKKVKSIVKDVPVLIGSGTNLENVGELLNYADGAIIGTAFKVNGISENPVDADRTRALMDKVNEIISNIGG